MLVWFREKKEGKNEPVELWIRTISTLSLFISTADIKVPQVTLSPDNSVELPESCYSPGCALLVIG